MNSCQERRIHYVRKLISMNHVIQTVSHRIMYINSSLPFQCLNVISCVCQQLLIRERKHMSYFYYSLRQLGSNPDTQHSVYHQVCAVIYSDQLSFIYWKRQLCSDRAVSGQRSAQYTIKRCTLPLHVTIVR